MLSLFFSLLNSISYLKSFSIDSSDFNLTNYYSNLNIKDKSTNLKFIINKVFNFFYSYKIYSYSLNKYKDKYYYYNDLIINNVHYNLISIINKLISIVLYILHLLVLFKVKLSYFFNV